MALPLRRLKTDKALRCRVEKWFWAANIPLATYVCVFQPDVWERVSILYLALVSIWALVSGAANKEQTAEVAAEAKR